MFKMPSTQEKPVYVQRMFGEIAPTYDLLNDLASMGMHRFWKKKLVKLALSGQDDHILDICCGTGDVLLEMVKQVSSRGRVVGVDFSGPMLEVARQRLEKVGKAQQVELLEGDFLSLPFADNTFDAATVSFGLRNVSDIPKALREMHRVVKPGGRALCLDLGKPVNPVYKVFYDFYFFNVVPILGRVIHGKSDPYKYLPNSSKSYPAQEELVKMFKEAGFSKVEYFNLAGGATVIHRAFK